MSSDPMPPGAISRRCAVATGGELAFAEVSGNGVPLLLLHGFPFDRSMWAAQLSGLPGRRLLAPDLRGFGESEPVVGAVRIADYADDLMALLDALAIEAVTLCGFSMGGYIALDIARRYRERLRALILMDTRAEADTPEGKAGREAMIRAAAGQGAGAVAAAMLPRLFADQAPAGLRQQFAALMERAPVPGIVAALGAMRDRPDSLDLLPTLAGLPTLVVVGAQDQITPPEAARRIAGGVPGARLEVIPGAGHLAPAEQPELVNRRVQGFLDGAV
jgi:pimeloyl-ACP methyl ester carboxylesterase